MDSGRCPMDARLLGLVVAVGVAACQEKPPIVQHATATPATAVATARPSAPKPQLPACVPPVDGSAPPKFIAERSHALELLLNGDPRGALGAFEKELATKPTDVASYALRVAAQTTIGNEFAEEVKTLTHARAVPINTYPTKEVVNTPVDFPGTSPSIELRVVADEKAAFTMDWFTTNGVEQPDAPEPGVAVQQIQGLFLTKSLRHPDHRAAIFGGTLVTALRGPTSAPRVFDFLPGINRAASLDGSKPNVVFAQAVGKVLVVEFATTSTTGSITAGPLEAVDLDTGAVRWATDPGIGTAQSFVIAGRFAIVGEGVYATPSTGTGNIRAIDLTNGKVVDKKAIGFLPAYVVRKDGDILVDGVNGEDARLTTTPKLEPTPASDLPAMPTRDSPDPDGLAREKCVIERAARALDARDGNAALRELDVLEDKDNRAASAMRAASTFLIEAAQHPDDVVDLTATEPVVVSPVSVSFKSHAETRTLGAPPVLTKKESTPTTKPGANATPQPQPPPRIDYAAGVTFQVPDDYAGSGLTRSYAGTPTGGSDATVQNLVIYGPHIAVLRGHRMQSMFDITALLKIDPSEATPTGTLEHALVRGDRLYVCIAGSAPQLQGTVYAIDMTKGAVVWRSDADTCSARFADVGDYFIAGRGARGANPKAPSKSALVILRIDTGATVSTVPLPSAPTDIGFGASSRVVVFTESHYLTYAVGY